MAFEDYVYPECRRFWYDTQRRHGIKLDSLYRLIGDYWDRLHNVVNVPTPRFYYHYFTLCKDIPGEFSRLYPLFFIHQRYIRNVPNLFKVNNSIWNLKRKEETVDLGPVVKFFHRNVNENAEIDMTAFDEFLREEGYELRAEKAYDHLWYYRRFFSVPAFEPDFLVSTGDLFPKYVLKSWSGIPTETVSWFELCKEMYEAGYALLAAVFWNRPISWAWIARAIEYYSRIIGFFYHKRLKQYYPASRRIECKERLFLCSFYVLQLLVKMRLQEWIDGRGGWSHFHGMPTKLSSSERMPSPLRLKQQCEMIISRGGETALPPALLMPFVARKLFYGAVLALSGRNNFTGDEEVMFHADEFSSE